MKKCLHLGSYTCCLILYFILILTTRNKYQQLMKEMGDISENFTSVQQQLADLTQTYNTTSPPTTSTTTGKEKINHKVKVSVSVKLTESLPKGKIGL